jgi:hypothetical protein
LAALVTWALVGAAFAIGGAVAGIIHRGRAAGAGALLVRA